MPNDPARPNRDMTLMLKLPEEWAKALKKAADDTHLSMHEYVRAMFEGTEQLHKAAAKLDLTLPRLKAGRKGRNRPTPHPELREHFRTAMYPTKKRHQRKKYNFEFTKPDDWDDLNE